MKILKREIMKEKKQECKNCKKEFTPIEDKTLPPIFEKLCIGCGKLIFALEVGNVYSKLRDNELGINSK